jgi:hypothetical protein
VPAGGSVTGSVTIAADSSTPADCVGATASINFTGTTS